MVSPRMRRNGYFSGHLLGTVVTGYPQIIMILLTHQQLFLYANIRTKIILLVTVGPRIIPGGAQNSRQFYEFSRLREFPEYSRFVATLQTASRSVQWFLHSARQKVPILLYFTRGQHHSPQNFPFACGSAGLPSNTRFLGPIAVLT